MCEDVDFEDLKLYSFGEEIKPYEYYLDDGETKDFTIESHIRMLSCKKQLIKNKVRKKSKKESRNQIFCITYF